jgi:hypothetical protein
MDKKQTMINIFFSVVFTAKINVEMRSDALLKSDLDQTHLNLCRYAPNPLSVRSRQKRRLAVRTLHHALSVRGGSRYDSSVRRCIPP